MTLIIPNKVFSLRKVIKKGGPFLVERERNLIRATILLASCYTSLIFLGGDIFNIALYFMGFTSIPWGRTMNPRNFPTETQKAHLL